MTTKKGTDPKDDESRGMLDDAASLDTTGIGILGNTAQVNVILPQIDDDDLADDEVVDGEVVDLIIDDEPVFEPAPTYQPEPESSAVTGSIVIELPEDVALAHSSEPIAPARAGLTDAGAPEIESAEPETAEPVAVEAEDDADPEEVEAEPEEVEPEPEASEAEPEAVEPEEAAVEGQSTEPAEPEITEPAEALHSSEDAVEHDETAEQTEAAAPEHPEAVESPEPITPVEFTPILVPDAVADTASESETPGSEESAVALSAQEPPVPAVTHPAEPEPALEAVAAAPSLTKPEAEPETAALVPAAVSSRSAARREAPAADDGAEGKTIVPRRTRASRNEAALASRRLDDLGEASRESADLLTADRLLDPIRLTKPEPEGTWSHFLYTISGRRINIGDGRRARERKALSARIAAPLAGGARFVPVLSRKGGVGKTTITALLGMALADAREDRVIAVDANPDRGTLADRVVHSTHTRSVRDLVRIHDDVKGYHDISAIVARDATRLDVLASDSDPRIAEAFSDSDYRDVAGVAAHYYSLVLTDTGTGIVHSVMSATLDLADQIVIVSGLSVDEARLASETLTWLETNGYAEQAREAIVVLNQSTPGAPLVRLNELEAHFATRARKVVRMPYDSQIAAGGTIVFANLQPETRVAARELAALLVEGLRARAS